MIVRLLLIIVIVSVATACKREYSYEAFVQYVNDPKSGLVLSKNVNGVDFKVTYWPSELIAWPETNNSTDISLEEWEQLLNHYNQYLYFKVEISGKGQEILNAVVHNRQKYSQLVNDLMFGMNEKLRLINPGVDTLELVDVHTPRFYGIAAATQLICVFSRETADIHNLRLEIDDTGLYTGDIRFEFAGKKLRKIPKLKFSTNNFKY